MDRQALRSGFIKNIVFIPSVYPTFPPIKTRNLVLIFVTLYKLPQIKKEQKLMNPDPLIFQHHGCTIHHEYDARDLTLIPGNLTEAETRAQVKWDVTLTPMHGHKPITIVPLWCANVHFAGLRLAQALTDWQPPNVSDPSARVQIALRKGIPEKDLGDFIIKNGTSSAWVTVGINGQNEDELPRLRRIFDRVCGESQHSLNKIVIDASNGHMRKMMTRAEEVRSIVGSNAIILAGNVVTGSMTEQLLRVSDGVKVNHGPAKVCRTRHNAGTHRPTFTAAAECAQAASPMGGFVISDGGGISQSGTAAVLFTVADGVMSGSLFAGHEECDAAFGRNWSPFDPDIGFFERFMWYYGSASMDALQNDHGGKAMHRPVEGTKRKVESKPSLTGTLEQWLGGIASAGSFQSDAPYCRVGSDGKPNWDFHTIKYAKDRLSFRI